MKLNFRFRTHFSMRIVASLCFFVFFTLSLRAQTPQILWWFDTNDSAFGQTAMDDLDGDGYPDLVFGCYRNDSMVYALKGQDGSLLWKYNTSGFGEGCNDVASLIYDINGDGLKEVVVPSSCNPVTYCFEGATGTIIWQTPTRGSDSPPVIGDINLDGNLEILHGEFGGYVISIDALTGDVNWEIAVDLQSWIQTAPTLVDLNQDGYLDIVVATWNFNNENKIYAYSGEDQSLLWIRNLNDVVYHGTAVLDLDDDGLTDLVIGDYSGRLYALQGNNGDVLWTYDGPGYIGSPVSVADLDGDGSCDLVFSSGSRIIALEKSGTLKWNYAIPNFGQSFRGSALADITQDSLPEVIFGTSNGLLIALDGSSGLPLFEMDLAAHYGNPLDFNHAPVVGDLDNNGIRDVFIVGGHTEYPMFENNYGRAYAIEVGAGSGPEWPMFQYNATRTGNACQNETSSSVSPLQNNLTFSILPNPVASGESLWIQMDESFSPGWLRLYDLLGRQVQELYFMENDIQWTLMAKAGNYIITFTTQDRVLTQRLIIH